MNAITLREPWASLVAIGAKKIETRSWPAPASLVGQRIAIHAAKGLTEFEFRAATHGAIGEALHESGVPIYPLVDDDDRRTLLQLAFGDTRGCVIATAVLADCVQFNAERVDFIARSLGADELSFGDFTPGRYGWYLVEVERLPEPIPAKGALGVWEWTPPAGCEVLS